MGPPWFDMHPQAQRYPPRCRSYCTLVTNPPPIPTCADRLHPSIPLPPTAPEMGHGLSAGNAQDTRLRRVLTCKPLLPEFSQHPASAVDQGHSHSNPPIPPRNQTRSRCPFITLMHLMNPVHQPGQIRPTARARRKLAKPKRGNLPCACVEHHYIWI